MVPWLVKLEGERGITMEFCKFDAGKHVEQIRSREFSSLKTGLPPGVMPSGFRW